MPTAFDTSGVPRISVEDAWQAFQRGEAAFVDVRNRLAFERSHVPGAYNLPLMEMNRRVRDLPGDRLLVFY